MFFCSWYIESVCVCVRRPPLIALVGARCWMCSVCHSSSSGSLRPSLIPWSRVQTPEQSRDQQWQGKQSSTGPILSQWHVTRHKARPENRVHWMTRVIETDFTGSHIHTSISAFSLNWTLSQCLWSFLLECFWWWNLYLGGGYCGIIQNTGKGLEWVFLHRTNNTKKFVLNKPSSHCSEQYVWWREVRIRIMFLVFWIRL